MSILNNQVKERPIVFTTDEVHDTLEGRKTRFLVPIKRNSDTECLFNGNWRYDGLEHMDSPDGNDGCYPNPQGNHYVEELATNYDPSVEHDYTENYVSIGKCHLGSIGDNLWVQEAYSIAYRADDLDNLAWCGAETMPRWASRLLLEITEVRPSPVHGANDQIVNWVWVIDFRVVEVTSESIDDSK